MLSPDLESIELSIVMPLYCEEVGLARVITEVVRAVSALQVQYELILVDDGSSDQTWQAILAQCQINRCVKGIRLSRNFGKESALAAGLDQASGNAVLVMDGDLQHPAQLIAVMYQHWRDGAEVVDAIKDSRGKESIFSRTAARAFYSVFSSLAGYNLRGAADFKLMDRRVVDAWRKMNERNLFFRGMNAWLGFRRVQVPFEVAERVGGQSAWSVVQLTKLAIHAITSFSTLPLHLITILGFGFSIFALMLGAQTIYYKLTQQALDGFTTVILLLLMIGGAMMIGLGIIGLYIARIYEEVKARPRYLVSETTDQRHEV